MSRGVMRRYGMERFFCGTGTVPYTPPSSKMPAGERKSPSFFTGPPEGGMLTPLPHTRPAFPRRAGNGPFTITQPRGPFSRRLNCTWELFQPSAEPTITWLQSAGRAAAEKQNAASMHKHRYTAFMGRSITAPLRKKSKYSVSAAAPLNGKLP